jgi:Holliday junction resolvase RusA-like endonuclease
MKKEKLYKKFNAGKSTINQVEKYISDYNKNSKFKTVKIVLNRDIKGQARPRVGMWKNIYDPDKKYKKELSDEILRYLVDNYKNFKISKKKIKGRSRLKKRISNDIYIKIIHYREIPRGFSLKKKILCLLNVIKVNTIPDVDNLIKMILDTLNVSVIKDDRFLWKTKIIKKWAEKPKCIIKIRYRV